MDQQPLPTTQSANWRRLYETDLPHQPQPLVTVRPEVWDALVDAAYSSLAVSAFAESMAGDTCGQVDHWLRKLAEVRKHLTGVS